MSKKIKKLSFTERASFIGHAVKQQYAEGLYQIADWADIISAHTVPGPGVIAITQNGADIIIVGRGIYQASHPAASVRQYRKSDWEAYLSCC